MIAVGYPDSIYSETEGLITDLGYIDYELSSQAITHSAEIDHGSSGGVLVNTSYKIIEINFVGYYDGVACIESYVVPLETILIFVDGI